MSRNAQEAGVLANLADIGQNQSDQQGKQRYET
jgi:hypothetical protein